MGFLLKKTVVVVFLLSISLNLFGNNTQETTKYKTNTHGQLDNAITELADKLFLFNKIIGDNEEIAITSFVDLHQFDNTSHFGRTISEAFFDELFTRGFNVTDFRGQETLSINKNGEYFLTRDINLLNKNVTSAYVLVGTYSYFENKLVINARILDNQTGKVLASARSNYETKDCRALNNCKKPRRIYIVKTGMKTKDIKRSISIAKNSTTSSQNFIRPTDYYNKPSKTLKEETSVEQAQDMKEDIEVKTKTKLPLINLIN